MESIPPPPTPRPQDWTQDAWRAGLALLVAEDSRFAEVAFRIVEEPALHRLEVTGPAELIETLITPGWNTVIRGFVRRAAKEMNRAETRHALEDASWPAFVVAIPRAHAVQRAPMETPAVQPPQTPPASPSLLPAPADPADPGPAPLRAHPFLDAPIAGEDELVRQVRTFARFGQHEVSEASEKMLRVCLRIWAMLDAKNRAYGNSALDPVRVFSRADPAEQIRVRLDDKLSRLARGHAAGEDVVQDFMGYLVLLKVAELPWPTEK